jgi:hypothetical protein
MERKLRQNTGIGKEAGVLHQNKLQCNHFAHPRKYAATSSSSYINRRKAKIVRVMRTVGKIDYSK